MTSSPAPLDAADHLDPVVGAALQPVLDVLTELALLGKHAHWNVVGPRFRAVHPQLDELIETWREAADEVAERAVALGYAADGRVASLAERAILSPPPGGPIADVLVLSWLHEVLVLAARTVRATAGRVEELDVVTADLLHALIATLEKQAWMARAQSS